jgi:subtilisin family serine protease
MQQYIIDFVNSATDEDINGYLTACGATIIKSFTTFEKVYLVEATTEPAVTDIVEHVIHDESDHIQLLNTVIVADANYGKVVTDGSVPAITVDNADKNWWKLYSLAEPDLDAPEIVTNRRGSGSIVYVLDSGVDFSHPEFDGADTHSLFSFNNDFTDRNGHGTALASVIAGKTCSLTNATVKSVKIFDPANPTKQSDMLNALEAIHQDYLISNAEHYIVNASWSIPKNQFIENKIRQLMSHGIFFVVAAGNSGQPISDVTPASMPEVLTIGSYNNHLLPSDFTNYTGGSSITFTAGTTNHGELDGFAPGEMIWAAKLDGSYGYVAGTSIAAAIVSSALAYNFNTVEEYSLEYSPFSTHRNNRMVSLGRRGLLDLSDPKYSSSNNQVVTFFDTKNHIGDENIILSYYKTVENTKFNVRMFNPWQVKQIEVINDLPSFLHIVSTGSLFGITPALADTERFEKIIISMIVTYTDDTSEPVTFTLLNTKDDFDTTVETTGDPTLDIVLQADYSCLSAGQPGECSDSFCADNCGGSVGCTRALGQGGCTKTQWFCSCNF